MKLDDHWKGAVPQVDEWWTGDANSPIVLLQNDQEEVERSPIYNSKALFEVISSCSRLLSESRDMLEKQVAYVATLYTPQTCLIPQFIIDEWER